MLSVISSCLQKCSPSHCPVCRGAYRKEKIKKLHVETTIVGRDDIIRVSSPSAIAEYLQMVAMVSGEGILDVDVEKVSARVDEWIASLPQNMKLQVSLRLFASAFSAFCFRTRVFDHFFFTMVPGKLAGVCPLKVSCARMADQPSCYSHNRSVLHSDQSKEVEKYSTSLRRPEQIASRPNESWIELWMTFGAQSWSRTVCYSRTAIHLSTFLSIPSWLLLT